MENVKKVHSYEFISKNNKDVKEAYKNYVKMINEVQDLVRDQFTFRFDPIGSFDLNVITYDPKTNIGYDFDINIEPNDDDENYGPKELNNILINAFKQVVHNYGYNYPSRSSRVFTIKKVNTKQSRIIHSCDFAIVHSYEDGNGNKLQEYVRFNKQQNNYVWEQQGKGFYQLPEKIKWIKDNDLWEDFKECYLYLKNTNTDENCHSRSLRAKAAHIICQRNGYFD